MGPFGIVEAFGEEVIAVLLAGGFLILGKFLGQHHELLLAVQAEGVIEAGGEEARLEARGAEEGLLGESEWRWHDWRRVVFRTRVVWAGACGSS